MSKWIIERSSVMECPVFEEDLKFPLRNIYCVGRNYRDHAIEMGSNPDRDLPFFFQKTSDIILKDGATLKYPIDTSSLHYEVELVVFISKDSFQIKASEAKNIIFGYGVGVDITKR
ncbi:MAG: fumarylacetoacetate hydrolase family protein, partial [Candidatus Marinimicrobia bacterium]|nr:fumarylacetoacetate hydrolase family protein [Candidatus Neomarinimicrobiota bacterium]